MGTFPHMQIQLKRVVEYKLHFDLLGFIAINILVSVDTLQSIVDRMDPSNMYKLFSIRGMLSEVLPLGPLIESEIEYGGANRSTPEEIVGWMEGEFYAGFAPCW